MQRPGRVKKAVGVDVRGFRHAMSNQAAAKTMKDHGNDVTERLRGQRGITRADFQRLPQIVRGGEVLPGKRKFGAPRIEIVTSVGGYEYHYIAEVRTGVRRLDMISMWKREG